MAAVITLRRLSLRHMGVSEAVELTVLVIIVVVDIVRRPRNSMKR